MGIGVPTCRHRDAVAQVTSLPRTPGASSSGQITRSLAVPTTGEASRSLARAGRSRPGGLTLLPFLALLLLLLPFLLLLLLLALLLLLRSFAALLRCCSAC